MAVTLTANFDIYNEETVKRLQEEDPDILPTYTTDKKKDLAYNKKQVTAAITSAVIQGKSIDKIADDLQTRMTSINRSGAIKTARTAVTNAQNGGTLSSMKELAAMGIEVQKEWVATLDDRTRPSHRALDGQRRDLDKAFSNGLQYPGDSSGNAAEVWNCRCTMVSYIPEYDSNDEPRVTYSDWEAYKQKTGSTAGKISEAEYKAAQIEKNYIHVTRKDGEWYYNEKTGVIIHVDNTTGRKTTYDPNTNTVTVEKNGKVSTGGLGEGTYDHLLKNFGKKVSQKVKTAAKKVTKAVAAKTSRNTSTNTGMLDALRQSGVEYNPVQEVTARQTDERIISILSGGDMTSGSCASLALAYCGRKAGYKVTDYRGGTSRDIIASSLRSWVKSTPELNAKVYSNATTSREAGLAALKDVLSGADGKEYVLEVGRHASVVRKKGRVVQYLELQSQYSEINGWNNFNYSNDDHDTLGKRFGCSKSYGTEAILTEVSSFSNSGEFRKILGYINTDATKQQKGSGGSVK